MTVLPGGVLGSSENDKPQLHAPTRTILTHVTLNRKANCRSIHAARFHLYEVQNQANHILVDFCNIGKECKDDKLKFRIAAPSLGE